MEVLNFNANNDSNRDIPAASSITLPVAFKTRPDVRLTRLRVPKRTFPEIRIRCHGGPYTAAQAAYFTNNRLLPTGISLIIWDTNKSYAEVKAPFGSNYSQICSYSDYNNLVIQANTEWVDDNDHTQGEKTTIQGLPVPSWPGVNPVPGTVQDLASPATWGLYMTDDLKNGIVLYELLLPGVPTFKVEGSDHYLVEQSVTVENLADAFTRHFYRFAQNEITTQPECDWYAYVAAATTDTKITVVSSVASDYNVNPVPPILISRDFAELLVPGSSLLPAKDDWNGGYNIIKNMPSWQLRLKNLPNSPFGSEPFALIRDKPEIDPWIVELQQATFPVEREYNDAFRVIDSFVGNWYSRPAITNSYHLKLDYERLMPVSTLLVCTPDLPIQSQRIVANNTKSTGSINPSFLPIIKTIVVSADAQGVGDLIVVDDALTTTPTKCEKGELFTITVKLFFLMKDNSLEECKLRPGETLFCQLSFSP